MAEFFGKVTEFFGRIGQFFDSIRQFFESIGETLGQLRDWIDGLIDAIGQFCSAYPVPATLLGIAAAGIIIIIVLAIWEGIF